MHPQNLPHHPQHPFIVHPHHRPKHMPHVLPASRTPVPHPRTLQPSFPRRTSAHPRYRRVPKRQVLLATRNARMFAFPPRHRGSHAACPSIDVNMSNRGLQAAARFEKVRCILFIAWGRGLFGWLLSSRFVGCRPGGVLLRGEHVGLEWCVVGWRSVVEEDTGLRGGCWKMVLMVLLLVVERVRGVLLLVCIGAREDDCVGSLTEFLLAKASSVSLNRVVAVHPFVRGDMMFV